MQNCIDVLVNMIPFIINECYKVLKLDEFIFKMMYKETLLYSYNTRETIHEMIFDINDYSEDHDYLNIIYNLCDLWVLLRCFEPVTFKDEIRSSAERYAFACATYSLFVDSEVRSNEIINSLPIDIWNGNFSTKEFTERIFGLIKGAKIYKLSIDMGECNPRFEEYINNDNVPYNYIDFDNSIIHFIVVISIAIVDDYVMEKYESEYDLFDKKTYDESEFMIRYSNTSLVEDCIGFIEWRIK